MVKDSMDLLELLRNRGVDGAFWLSFLRSLSARGLEGVELVISDAHRGLRDAIATVFSGASWSAAADRTHFMTNLLTRVPKSAQPWVATMVRPPRRCTCNWRGLWTNSVIASLRPPRCWPKAEPTFWRSPASPDPSWTILPEL